MTVRCRTLRSASGRTCGVRAGPPRTVPPALQRDRCRSVHTALPRQRLLSASAPDRGRVSGRPCPPRTLRLGLPAPPVRLTELAGEPTRSPARAKAIAGRPTPRHLRRSVHGLLAHLSAGESCNDEMIGGLTVRRFGNNRRPDSWCPAHVARLVSVANAGVRGVSRPDGCPSRRRPAGHQCGPGVVPAPATADMATRGAEPDAVSGTAAPQAAAAFQARWMWSVSGRHDHRAATRERERSCRRQVPDTSAVAVRHAVQVPDTRGRYPTGGCVGYGNRSPGRRPLVGCSQRRWARASRAVRRPRSWPRT